MRIIKTFHLSFFELMNKLEYLPSSAAEGSEITSATLLK